MPRLGGATNQGDVLLIDTLHIYTAEDTRGLYHLLRVLCVRQKQVYLYLRS